MHLHSHRYVHRVSGLGLFSYPLICVRDKGVFINTRCIDIHVHPVCRPISRSLVNFRSCQFCTSSPHMLTNWPTYSWIDLSYILKIWSNIWGMQIYIYIGLCIYDWTNTHVLGKNQDTRTSQLYLLLLPSIGIDSLWFSLCISFSDPPLSVSFSQITRILVSEKWTQINYCQLACATTCWFRWG